MLANDLVLDKADGTDVTFRLVSQQPDGSRRIDIGGTMALPHSLVIRHSTTGKSPNLTDRHLVQLSKSVATATGVGVVTVNFTLTVPRDVAVTPTIVKDEVSHVLDFLSDSGLTGFASTANVDAILRGES